MDVVFAESSSGKVAAAAAEVAAWKRSSKRPNFDDDDEEEGYVNLSHALEPVKIELNRLQDELKERDRELADAHNEIKGLRLIERAKDKALGEVSEELKKMCEKLQASEAALENKNLEIKRITDEKKEALAAQYAAEAALRRVHAAQKDEDLPPIEDILLPLDGEIKFLRQEIVKLQDDNKALERLTKSKEVALLEAEREVQLAKIKAALVDDLQNKNQQLMKQNDICQEEYKILDKMHRQKVVEVEKLGQTVGELEEALLSGAVAANAVRDYQRQVGELKEEKRTLERMLSRVMVAENRIATAIANEWKDDYDKAIPAKQWIEERRILTGEIQQLRDKLSVAERTAKAEAQLKERLQLRLKVVEDGLKSSLRSGIRGDTRGIPNGLVRSRSINGAGRNLISQAKGASKSFDGGNPAREKCSCGKPCSNSDSKDSFPEEIERITTGMPSDDGIKEGDNGKVSHTIQAPSDDFVSVVLYDILQKEVISLRKACHEKDQHLKDKGNSIEMLSRKLDTLSRAMEVETKKLRREKSMLEKEVAAMQVEMDRDIKARRLKGVISNLT